MCYNVIASTEQTNSDDPEAVCKNIREKPDKDCFHRDLGGVEEAYAEILPQLEAHLA